MAFDVTFAPSPPPQGAARLSQAEKAALFDLAQCLCGPGPMVAGAGVSLDAARLIQAFAQAYCQIRDRQEGIV